MKREMGLLLVSLVLSSFSSGCVSHRTVVVRERPVAVEPGEVVVTTEPPKVRREVRTIAPSAAAMTPMIAIKKRTQTSGICR